MVFNSAQFLLFLPLAALGYFAVPQKARRPWLLLACYFFYFCWNPAHVPVLAFVTAVGYLGGRLLEGKPRKGVLAAGILLALAPLIGFKYLGFLTKSVLSVLAHLGVQIAPPAFDFLLPMGISFYTLQAVGYLVDTYRGEKAEHNLLDFALFVGFFPQMVSGPISRGNRLLPQLSAAKRPAFDDLRDGVLLLIWGYFLKIVVAGPRRAVCGGSLCTGKRVRGLVLHRGHAAVLPAALRRFRRLLGHGYGHGQDLGHRPHRQLQCALFFAIYR